MSQACWELIELSISCVCTIFTYLFDSAPSFLLQWVILFLGESWFETLRWSGLWLSLRVTNGFCKGVTLYLASPSFASLFRLVTRSLLLLVKFILVDSKDEWLEAESEDTLEQLMAEINDVFGVTIESWDWQCLAKVRDMGCMLTFRIPSMLPDLDFDTVSDQPQLLDLNAGKVTVLFSPDDDAEDWLEQILEKQDQDFDSLVNRAMVGMPIGTPTRADIKLLPISRFVGSFNPGVAGRDLLMVERYQQRHAPKRKHKVTVDLRKCRESMQSHVRSNVCMFPEYEEFVMNVAGPAALPLIVDSGASCCVSPC